MNGRELTTGPYKEHFACFACRKVFKQPPLSELPQDAQPEPGTPRDVLCPQCRAPMVDVGKDFEAPRRSAAKQWRLAELSYRHGIALAGGHRLRAAELEDMDALKAARMTGSEGERLLRALAERRRRRR